MNGGIGSESATRIIWETAEGKGRMEKELDVVTLSGEPYARDDARAKADPDEYVWTKEQDAWLSSPEWAGFGFGGCYEYQED